MGQICLMMLSHYCLVIQGQMIFLHFAETPRVCEREANIIVSTWHADDASFGLAVPSFDLDCAERPNLRIGDLHVSRSSERSSSRHVIP